VEAIPHRAGSFCFPELGTQDVDGARRFYGALLGWTTFDLVTASAAGPSAWLCHVTVDDADRVARRALELGGRQAMAPCDLPGRGRRAAIVGPEGVTFGLWEAGGSAGPTVPDEPGAPCWYELLIHDLAASERFYSQLFGWTATERAIPTVGPYTTFKKGEEGIAGMMTIREEWGETPCLWQVYFAVNDCADAARQAQALGGRVVAGPVHVPDLGRFAVLEDPSEAVFVAWESANRF